jgi:Holliday junction resolvasome RuvABC DNA-binding subunit
MKITIQDNEYTSSVESTSDDAVCINQAVEMIRGALAGVGFTAEQVAEAMPDEFQLDEIIAECVKDALKEMADSI